MTKRINIFNSLLIRLVILLFIIFPVRLYALNGWSGVVGPGVQNWNAIASSQDGTKLVAATYGGYIYTSDDGGQTWTQRLSAGSRNWRSVASSADGVNLAAVVINGYMYTSNDSGITWVEHTSIGSAVWSSIASSANGQNLFVGNFSTPIATSTDGGITWSQLSSGSYLEYDVAVSADGNKVITIFGDNQNTIYISSDAGSTWTSINPPSCNSVNMRSISMSPDGMNIFIASDIRSDNSDSGWICSSTDGGTTWNTLSSAGKRNWYDIVSSSDGTKITASVSNDYVYSSIDGGVTWTPYTDMSPRNMLKMAISDDGSKIAAVDYSGYIYIYGEVTLGAVTTLSASNIQTTYATLNMSITDIGHGLLQYGVEYGTTTNYGSIKSYPAPANVGVNSVSVGRLECNTVYHYRAFVGTGAGTSYGGDTMFTTASCSSVSTGQILYGVDGAGRNPEPPNLYKIDSFSGIISELVGATGHNLTGIAFHPETKILYGVSGGNDIGGHVKSLYTVSTTTGLATWMGTLKTGSNQVVIFPDIAFRSDGRLYGFSNSWGGDPTTADLYTIDLNSCNGTTDTNCLVVKVGDSDLNPFGNGLVFDDQGKLFLFGNGQENYYEINPDSGATIQTFDFAVTLNLSINAATIDENGQIYVARTNFGSQPADLVKINTSDHTVTSTGINYEFQYMDALAFDIPTTHPVVDTVPTPVPIDSGPVFGTFVWVPGVMHMIVPTVEQNTVETQHVDVVQTNSIQANIFTILPASIMSPNTQSSSVRLLQEALNSLGFTVALSGPGSPGNETTKFGILTTKALQNFQCKKLNICSGTPKTTGYGNIGPKTRVALNSLLVK